MGPTDNMARIRNGYQAFNKGDFETLLDLFADDIVWHFPGSSKLAGDHVGRGATMAMLGAYGQATGGTLRANLLDIMASDDHVAGWANDTATVDDKTLDVRAVVIFKMSDGKVTEAWHHFDDLTSLDNLPRLTARSNPQFTATGRGRSGV